MPANQTPKSPAEAPTGTTGGTAVPGVAPTLVFGDVHTEGAVTERGTVTSHPGAPTPPPPGAGVVRRDMPPATPEPESEFTVRNMLQQPLHHRTGTVKAGGTFSATAKEILAYGKQVERV